MPSKHGGQKRKSPSCSNLSFCILHLEKKVTQVLDPKQVHDEGEQCEQAGRTPCPAEAPQQSEQVCPLHIDWSKTNTQIADTGGIVEYCVLDFK